MAAANANGDEAETPAQVSDAPAANNTAAAAATASKPKRVRTGCLTCRERHLKCDEALPTCMNCRKSARVCKRGIRLNFIDTQCQRPPVIPPQEQDYRLQFLDESREIASEYRGGLAKYASIEAEPLSVFDNTQYDTAMSAPSAPAIVHQALPSIHGMAPNGKMDEANNHTYNDSTHSNQQYHDQRQNSTASFFDPPDASQFQHPGSAHSSHSHASMTMQQTQYPQQQQQMQQQQPPQQQAGSSTEAEEASEARQLLNSSDETLYMQVFVEEVGLWMDTMDPMKHFSELLPFHALGRPMLLNAFLACGVRHLTLVNPQVYKEEKALNYYDRASRYLLRALENPERDSVICATTAVILNVYEIMTEKALPRMNHIAGARALIKECGWNAKSTGIGAACFWLNVGLETLSNLHFNWQASWPPDSWGLDLDLEKEVWPGREEIWTHKMLFIIAKIGDFRATIPKQQEASPQDEQSRRQQRWHEWTSLKNLCDQWSSNIPRTMQPMAYLYSYQTSSKSAFPEVWLIKRTTIVARLFYHTAMVLLAQVNPMMPNDSPEMKEMELQHAHQICGIVAHVKDRGVASVAIRSLAHAAECLTSRREQEEVLQIFTKIHKETGWRIGFLPEDLRKKWGWAPGDLPVLPTHENPNQGMSNGLGGMMKGSAYQFDQYGEYQRLQQEQAQARADVMEASQRKAAQYQQQQAHTSPHSSGGAPKPSPRRPAPPQGIVNPMFAGADFSMPKHPYQDSYVAPTHQHQSQQQTGLRHGLGLGLPPTGYSAMFSMGHQPQQAQFPTY